MDVGVDWSIWVRILVAPYSLDDGSPGTDRAQDGVDGSVLGDGLISFFVFLHDEGNGDGFSQEEHWGVLRDFFPVAEEPNVPDCQEFRSSLSRDLGIFTRTHGEEEGPHHELTDSQVKSKPGGAGLIDDLFYNIWGDCFLVDGSGVAVGHAFQLAVQKPVEASVGIMNGGRQLVSPEGRCQRVEGTTH